MLLNILPLSKLILRSLRIPCGYNPNSANSNTAADSIQAPHSVFYVSSETIAPILHGIYYSSNQTIHNSTWVDDMHK